MAPLGVFDGRGGTLAHAFFPPNGDAHFDDSESFSVTPNRGTQLLWVTAHEFGHSIGLDHTSVRGSIMWRSFTRWNTNLQLGEDDRRGVRALYGPPTNKPTVGGILIPAPPKAPTGR